MINISTPKDFTTAIESYDQLVERIKQLKTSFKVQIIGQVELLNREYPIYSILSEPTDNKLPFVLLTAMVHGNEKGGVEAILSFLENDAPLMQEDFNFVCYPCINPRGYLLDTRWNGELPNCKTDLNRSFFDNTEATEAQILLKSLRKSCLTKFFCSIDLHETPVNDAEMMALQYPDREENDWEDTPTSFYMYEICEDHNLRVGSEVIQELEKTTTVCKWPEIAKDKNSEGVIYYPEGAQNQDYVQGNSLDSYLFKTYTDHAFTTETYADVAIEQRAGTQVEVIRLILKNLLKKK